MMKITIKAIVMAGAFCCLGFTMPSLAGQKLDDINAKVDQQAAEIDEKYGVLIDYQERRDLKLDLIAQQALSDATSEMSVKAIAEAAYATYEITDLYEQRKLLIKIESQGIPQKSTGNGSTPPEYP